MMRHIGLLSHLILFLLAALLGAKAPESSQYFLDAAHPIKVFSGNQNPQTFVKPPLIGLKSCVFIDAGHGGRDVGTQSITKPRYQEKSLNLVTARFVKGFLQQLGYQVIMSREEDKFVSLDKRAQMANEQKPVVFVSIHYNSAPSAEAQGIEVFYYHSADNKTRTAQSKRLAQSLLRGTLAETQAKSRGIKHGNYAVIRETKMPAVLIEGGFVTNESEMQKLKDPEYLKKLAWGIVKGIDEYLNGTG